MKKQILPFITFFLVLSLKPLPAQVYVDAAAEGNDSGTSWEDAYTDLQDALMNAVDSATIMVATGTYLPGTTSSATFLIDKKIYLLGGYNASTGERDPAMYETILSGDLNGDDVDDDFDSFKLDNVKNIVTITSTALLDGFTIQYGNANSDAGGGVYSAEAAPIIRNCTFRQNYARWDGGALYLVGSGSQGAVVEKCRFENNRAGSPTVNAAGGAMEVRVVPGAGVVVNECHFIGNGVTGEGGGLWSLQSNLTVKNSTFIDNTSENSGGGLSFRSTSEPDLTLLIDSCTFIGNHARSGGGLHAALGNNFTASITNSIFEGNEVSHDDTGEIPSGAGVFIFSFSNDPNSSNPGISLDNCHFQGNISSGRASAAGLGINAANTNVSLTNSTFLANECTGSGSTVGFSKNNGSGTVTVENCRLENNSGVYSAGLDLGARKPGMVTFTVRDCQILNNQANQYGGGLHLWGHINSAPSILIEDCDINGNSAGEKGGAIWVNTSSSNFHATLNRCKIQNNESPGGSAIGFTQFNLDQYALPTGASFSLENSLLTDNTGSGEVIKIDSFPGFQLINTTIADNVGSGIALDNHSGLTLQNTILANPGYGEYIGSAGAVTSNGGNLIDDNTMANWLNNTDQDTTNPLLDNNYRPTENSPAVDAGVPYENISEHDMTGEDRLQGSCIDIGALESSFDLMIEECMVVGTREILADAPSLDLFPNPAREFLHFQLPESNIQAVEVSLFDAQGRMMRRHPVFASQSIDVRSLTPGIYWVKAVVGDHVYSGKFVKP